MGDAGPAPEPELPPAAPEPEAEAPAPEAVAPAPDSSDDGYNPFSNIPSADSDLDLQCMCLEWTENRQNIG